MNSSKAKEPKKLNRKTATGNWASSGKGSRLTLGGRHLSEEKQQLQKQGEKIDARFGFDKYTREEKKIGWLLNMASSTQADNEGRERSGLDLYFIEQDGKTFKVTVFYEPYFFIAAKEKHIKDIMALLERRYEGKLALIEICEKEDLDLPNHLSGKTAKYLKLSFRNVTDLVEVKANIMPVVSKNQKLAETQGAYFVGKPDDDLPNDFMECIVDIREYDVPYHVRVSIDLGIRVGSWYKVWNETDTANIERQYDMLEKAEPIVLAFDIECTKAALRFPDSSRDQIYMISYMINRQGYLIVSRDIVSEDVRDFEYSPKQEYPGPFIVFNEPDEYHLIRRFIDHIQETKPHIFVTYNGDFFDWPFLDARAKIYDLDLFNEVGISADRNGEYRGRCSVHMDAFCWVKRDSYLPQGSQGLKSVTRYKLGYDPVEVDAEDMVNLAIEKPSHMASYSVSDAVATYYLYDKYVHLFVFSLCTIIPMGAEDVLRKGSGTLCEALLMVEAYKGNIICPNKEKNNDNQFFKGHLVENETYIGGHVECLESGVFRSDISYNFNLNPSAFDQLIAHIDRDLTFALEVELDVQRSEVENYDQVRNDIIEQLELLRDFPNRDEKPFIYHLDVAAMYPNIILTNRLQPCSIVNESACASCVHNKDSNQCKRPLDWVWRGDYYPATRPEYDGIKAQVEHERHDNIRYQDLKPDEKRNVLKTRLKKYCSTVYKKVKVTEEQKRTDVVCMRENPFYVNTVRDFRDRRYEYKILTKKWKMKEVQASKEGDPLAIVEAKTKSLVYDSLQLAHKCILNSFYGYVMRRGARWHSMEMAGIVTNTGSSLITRARKLVEQIGRPLELDTDGIWCILPGSFPENFKFKLHNGNYLSISYPCVMLNADVHESYTNHQYQEIRKENGKYRVRSECSIFFEVDGPYRCMVLPASTEEGKLLKKRYAVFNFDGSLAELKGFELKRRGELQLVKQFQSEVFSKFLLGKNLIECYTEVAECANHWLDILDTCGQDMDDEELIELISENKNMSGRLADYGSQKSTSITTARRLSEFLGEEMVKDKGLNCKLIIAARPFGLKVTERAVPTAIFSAEEAVKRHYLRKWLKYPAMEDFDIRSILDWSYYRTRFCSTLQKIISIPAAFQNIPNPIPRVSLPDWMARKYSDLNNGMKQTKLSGFIVMDKTKDVVEELIQKENVASLSRQSMFKSQLTSFGPDDHLKNKTISSQQDPSDNFQYSPIVDLSVGFSEWHLDRKKRWRELCKKRIIDNRNKLGSTTMNKNIGMDNYVVDVSASARQSHWQIVEFQELEEPGLFQFWAITSSNLLQKFEIRIPKTFYINCVEEPKESYGNKLLRKLPRGQFCLNLYQVTMSEKKYRINKKEILELLSDPMVLGVFESQVSPIARAVQCLGILTRLVNQKSSKSLKSTLELDELESVSSRMYNYLGNETVLNKVFFYFTYTGEIAVAGLFFKMDSNSNPEDENHKDLESLNFQSKVWIVDPYNSQKTKTGKPNLSNMFQNLRPNESSSCQFSTKIVSSISECFSGINMALGVYSSKTNRPTIVVTKTPFLSKRLREKIHGFHSFPIASLPWNDTDSIFPALTWKNDVCSRMIKRVFEMETYWKDLVACALYTGIPVGNFSGDHSIAILDTMYSRLLHKHNHLLWTSFTSCPDLGGDDTDDINKLLQEDHTVAFSLPGSYRHICVELVVDGLAVNTMLMASQIHQFEGMDGRDIQVIRGGENGDSSSPLNTNTCTEAFRILRILVTNLFKDFLNTRNKFADHLLQHFYRWVCSPSSQIYDPALQEMVSSMMKKLFLRLLLEFKTLGSQVIYADFGKILICTGRDSVSDAQSYCKFITETITSHELFQVLHFTIEKMYSNLLFSDSENYGCIDVSPDQVNQAMDVKESPVPRMISHWNIARHLPEGLQEYFLVLVGQFIRRQAEYLENKSKPLAQYEKPEEFEEDFQKYKQKMISKHFTEKLMTLVPEIMSDHTISSKFPTLPGSHLHLNNAALEFVKFLCHVFELDKTLEDSVRQLRRCLLKLLSISEYSEKGHFVNPSLTFVLYDLICLNCNLCRNLDLCRDAHVLQEESNESWYCPRCHTPYEKSQLEMRLVELVHQRILQYQLQDLRCSKCHLPQEDNLKNYCTCSGRFEHSSSSSKLISDLMITKSIACHHHFSWLYETVDSLIN